jgi:homeobox-leucine zipper protein
MVYQSGGALTVRCRSSFPAGICHVGRDEAPARGFDVNRAPSVAGSALALEDDEEEPGAAALSSSPNDSAGSFPLDLGGPRAHAEGAAARAGGERSSSRASDEDEGASARKKLRLSKEQSAFLEESFKEHSTLNPVRIHGNLLVLLHYSFLPSWS